MVSDEELSAAVEDARKALAGRGYATDVTPEEVRRWFEIPFPGADIKLDQLVKHRWLVVHELVEVEEAKREGWMPTADPERNRRESYARHLTATEIELDLAMRAGDRGHVEWRVDHIADWMADPLNPADQMARSEALESRVREWLRSRGA